MLRNLFKLHTKFNETTLYANLILKRDAGHSKWANIKHVKAQKDGQRSALFTKLGRQMRVAVTEGGSPDPSRNLKLERVVEQAKKFNMPAATIQSILKSTQTDKSKCKTHLLEIKGPGSSIILCEVFTDNLHHLRQTVTTVLKKHSSRFSDGGGIHLFQQKGIIETDVLKVEGISAEEVLELATEHAIESGAEDVKFLDDERLQFICSESTIYKVQEKLEGLKYKINNANVEFVPYKVQELSDDDLETCSSLYEKLENLPEVIKINDNIA